MYSEANNLRANVVFHCFQNTSHGSIKCVLFSLSFYLSRAELCSVESTFVL